MAIKKSYILGVVVVIVFALLILARPFYRNVIKPNKDIFPGFITRLIEARDNRQSPAPLVYKEEKTLKILEGWDLDDITKYLETETGLSPADVEQVSGRPQIDYRDETDLSFPPDFSEKFSFLKDKPAHYSLEGFLFPDTYRVFTDATAEDVIFKMLTNFDRRLTAEMRAEIERQGKTIYEVIIMASLIEKEAPMNYSDPENRDARIVSDIFWGRLKIGQALQSDATLSYLFNDNNPAHSGEELRVDSPYNSYKYRGLPPTPICNPGIKAIEAAIYPIPTNYNYFLTNLDGSNIYYASTYEEHLQNKYKYLK